MLTLTEIKKHVKAWLDGNQDIPPESEEYVLNLYNHHQMADPANKAEHIYFLSYCYIMRNYTYMQDYCLRQAEKNDLDSIKSLADNFRFLHGYQDLNQAKFYYQKAIDMGDIGSLCDLAACHKEERRKLWLWPVINAFWTVDVQRPGFFYQDKKQYDLTKFYLLQAIELDSTLAMRTLGDYYENREHNQELMRHYYNMAIALGDKEAMLGLGLNYMWNKQYDLMLHYFITRLQAGYHEASLCHLTVHLSSCCLTKDQKKVLFHLAVKYKYKNLIKATYSSKFGCYLLDIKDKYLSKCLIEQKKKYLLTRLAQENTWFCPTYCVRDVLGIIQVYLDE